MRRSHVSGGLAACAVAALAWCAMPADARAASPVTCQSDNYRYAHCPMNTRGGVTLSVQLSNGRGRCVAGRNWGWDGRGVWVNDGCRAVFSTAASGHPRDRQSQDAGRRDGRRDDGRQPHAAPLRPGAAHRGPPGFWPGGGLLGQMGAGRDRDEITVECASQGYRRTQCPVDTSGGVALVQQLSSHGGACVEGRSWGWSRYGIWVDDGCRARFRIWPDRQAGRSGSRR